MLDIASGFFVGVLTSILTWYVLSHWIVPSLEFFPHVYRSKTRENPSGCKYRVRFKNTGRRRILDLELFAKLRIRGLSTAGSTTWRAIYIPIDDARLPIVQSQRGTNKRIAVQLCVTEIDEVSRPAFPPEIQEKFQDRTVRLEDLMDLG